MTTADIVELLRNVNPLSIWGAAIHKILEDPTEERIMQLIEQLNSQAADNPQMMREILGAVIYKEIIRYDPNIPFSPQPAGKLPAGGNHHHSDLLVPVEVLQGRRRRLKKSKNS